MAIPVSSFGGKRLSRAIIFLSILPLAGCIASSPNSGGGQSQVAVTVTGPGASPFSIPVSTSSAASTAQFTATVTGSSNTAVTWSVAPNSGSGCTGTSSGGIGTIDASSGLYTAPTMIAAPPCQVIVTATSGADSTATGQALVGVHVTVAISPLSENIGQTANQQFTAVVTGTTNQAVSWSATGADSGQFDPNNPGLYVAPGLGTATTAAALITATSVFDQSQVSPTTTMTVLPSDPLGTVASYANVSPCPANGGIAGGACYQINTSCPGVADFSAYLKVNNPAGTPIGTVILGTGTGGATLYDSDPSFTDTSTNFNGGLTVVQDLITAGYNTVQISFGSPFNTATPNGWLQGPGGVRRLACRYATVVDWVYKNPGIINASVTATNSAPLCATGNSGGAGSIGYAVTDYGLGTELAMIEPTSGPVMTSLNKGCSACNNYSGPPTEPCAQSVTEMCYSSADAAIIDSAYQSAGSTSPTLCTAGVNGDNTNQARFLSDSILSTATAKTIPLHSTNVSLIFGGTDLTNAVPQGETWRLAIAPQNPTGGIPPEYCSVNAPHAIPYDPDGVAHIVSDITSLCQ
jgi:hypothetical protein